MKTTQLIVINIWENIHFDAEQMLVIFFFSWFFLLSFTLFFLSSWHFLWLWIILLAECWCVFVCEELMKRTDIFHQPFVMKIDITRNENNKSSNVPIIFHHRRNCAVHFDSFLNRMSVVCKNWVFLGQCHLSTENINALFTTTIISEQTHAHASCQMVSSIFHSIITIAFGKCIYFDLFFFLLSFVLIHSMYQTTNDVWFQLKHVC